MQANEEHILRPVDTYRGLADHVRSWFDGHIRFLAVIGSPGIGKSSAYEDGIDGTGCHLFKGRTSAIEIYKAVHDEPDWPIIFDDVGSLLKDQNTVELMKALCDSRPERRVQWRTATKHLEGRAQWFITSALVLLVCNRDAPRNDDVRAILDRADAISFEPTREEILAKIEEFADDPEIVEALRQMPIVPSLRLYCKAKEWKGSPYLDWRANLLQCAAVPYHVVAASEILRSVPPERQVDEYIRRTGRSRRDWFYTKKKAEQFLPTLHSRTGPASKGIGAVSPQGIDDPGCMAEKYPLAT